jgi:hypothetical protein
MERICTKHVVKEVKVIGHLLVVRAVLIKAIIGRTSMQASSIT